MRDLLPPSEVEDMYKPQYRRRWESGWLQVGQAGPDWVEGPGSGVGSEKAWEGAGAGGLEAGAGSTTSGVGARPRGRYFAHWSQ